MTIKVARRHRPRSERRQAQPAPAAWRRVPRRHPRRALKPLRIG